MTLNCRAYHIYVDSYWANRPYIGMTINWAMIGRHSDIALRGATVRK